MPFVQTNPIQMADNTANALVVREKVGGINYIEIDTLNGSEVTRIHPVGQGNAEFFGSSPEGVTKYVSISGYKTAGSLAEARLGVGVHTNQVLSIYNAAGYYFDNKVGIGTSSISHAITVHHTGTDALKLLRTDSETTGSQRIEFGVDNNYVKGSVNFVRQTGVSNGIGDIIIASDSTDDASDVSITDEKFRIKNTSSGIVSVLGTAPGYVCKETDGNPNENFITRVSAGVWELRTINDDFGGAVTKVSVKQNGAVGINEAAPDSKLCVNIGSGTGEIFSLKTDTTHAFTGLAEANTIFQIRETVNGTGGILLESFVGTGSYTSFEINAYKEAADVSSPIIKLMGADRSGGGGQAIGNADELLSIYNYTTEIITVKGNGDIATTGKVAGDLVMPVSIPSNPVAGSMYYDNSTPRLYIYDGAAWDYTGFTHGV